MSKAALFALMVAFLAATIAPPSLEAKDSGETGSIRYTFGTLLVPNEVKERSKTIAQGDNWLMGSAFPARAVVLDTDVVIPKKGITLPKGAMLSVANSAYFVACQEDMQVSVNMGMGRLPICLIDMDRDGKFDGWYKSSVSILWNEYAGHIQRDDIYPIAPTAPIRLTLEELRKTKPWSYFGIRYVRGVVTFCVNGGDLCSGGPRIKLTAADQTVEFMGGLFTLRQVGLPKDKKIAFGILRDPVGMVYQQ